MSMAGDRYRRTIDGRTDTMVEVAPNQFVNTATAIKLGLLKFKDSEEWN